MLQVGLGVGLFTAIILILVFVILAARSKLVAGGSVHLVINEDKEFDVPTGGKLMNALADLGIRDPPLDRLLGGECLAEHLARLDVLAHHLKRAFGESDSTLRAMSRTSSGSIRMSSPSRIRSSSSRRRWRQIPTPL